MSVFSEELQLLFQQTRMYKNGTQKLTLDLQRCKSSYKLQIILNLWLSFVGDPTFQLFEQIQ